MIKWLMSVVRRFADNSEFASVQTPEAIDAYLCRQARRGRIETDIEHRGLKIGDLKVVRCWPKNMSELFVVMAGAPPDANQLKGLVTEQVSRLGLAGVTVRRDGDHVFALVDKSWPHKYGVWGSSTETPTEYAHSVMSVSVWNDTVSLYYSGPIGLEMAVGVASELGLKTAPFHASLESDLPLSKVLTVARYFCGGPHGSNFVELRGPLGLMKHVRWEGGGGCGYHWAESGEQLYVIGTSHDYSPKIFVNNLPVELEISLELTPGMKRIYPHMGTWWHTDYV